MITSYAGPVQRTYLNPAGLLLNLKDRILTSSLLVLAILAVLGMLHVFLWPYLRTVSAAKLSIYLAVWFFLWANVGIRIGMALADIADYHADLLKRAANARELERTNRFLRHHLAELRRGLDFDLPDFPDALPEPGPVGCLPVDGLRLPANS